VPRLQGQHRAAVGSHRGQAGVNVIKLFFRTDKLEQGSLTEGEGSARLTSLC
jgi:hypothetical protein